MSPASRVAPRIRILHSDRGDAARLAELCQGEGWRVEQEGERPESLSAGEPHVPSLLIVADGARGQTIESLVRDLRHDPLLGRVPILAVVTEARAQTLDWRAVAIDDYVVMPSRRDEILRRITLGLHRMAWALDANPLTGLPGNTSIMQESARRLEAGAPFALAYLDLDHFKSFNDRYGYARGDEVLLVTCRLIVSAVQEFARQDGFVGHVGGDDFVWIARPEAIESICQAVVNRFDLVIPAFYDESDRIQGGIQSTDRRGVPEQFPLMSVSIAVVLALPGDALHPGELAARAAELKKLAKQRSGSLYLMDRRREPAAAVSPLLDSPPLR